MSVGDLSSTERGSGARFNDGKDPLHLVPVREWRAAWAPHIQAHEQSGLLMNVMLRVEAIQEGRDPEPLLYSTQNLEMAARVFDFGRKKYAAWNWSKGMDWSVPIGCVLRHMRAVVIEREELDPESGELHIGHIFCNLIMLDWFRSEYPEGNDRIPEEAFAHAK